MLLMANLTYKKILALGVLLLSLYGGHALYALTLTATDTVSVSARVGEEVTTTPGGTTTGGILIPKTAVSFAGQAYPYALVSLLKNGVLKDTIKASSVGDFNITIEEKYDSNVLYSLFAEDTNNNRSLLLNYPVAVQSGFLTQVSGIRFAPTILTDKSQVKAGDYLTVNGYALPNKDLEIVVDGMSKKTFTLTSNKDGSYKIVLPINELTKGDYYVYAKYKDDTRVSKFITFKIGDTNTYYTEALSSIPGDCNSDKVINLIDFSVLAFWYGKENPPKCVDTNTDSKIDLVDFSILAFYWTG